MINVNLHRPSAPLFHGLNEDLGPSRQEDKTKSSKMKQSLPGDLFVVVAPPHITDSTLQRTWRVFVVNLYG